MYLSQEFSRLSVICKKESISLEEIIGHLGTSLPALISIFFSVPFILFIPIPGLSIIFGILIFINGIRIALRKPVWLPNYLKRKTFKGAHLEKVFIRFSRWTRKIERWTKPRFHLLTEKKWSLVGHGVMLAVCGFFLALPLPPGTNFLPGLAAFFISLGMLEEDGLALLIGDWFLILNCALVILAPIWLARSF